VWKQWLGKRQKAISEPIRMRKNKKSVTFEKPLHKTEEIEEVLAQSEAIVCSRE
jgi:hypothetical protein